MTMAIGKATIGIAHTQWTLDGPALVEFCRRLDASGIDNVWIYEDFFEGEAVAQAAVILTQTQRINVGIAVTNPWVRHPALLAKSVAELTRLGTGRFRLGLGRSLPQWMRAIGVRSRPTEHVGEVVTVLRRLLAGEEVTGTAAGFELDRVKLKIAAPEIPPLYVSAMGPQMLGVAGRTADGVLIDSFVTPAWVREAVAVANRAADDAGRPQPRVAVQVAVADEHERPALRDWMSKQLSNPGWERTRLMWGAPADATRHNISEELLDEATAIGPPQLHLRRLQAYIEAGADEMFVTTRVKGKELEAAQAILSASQ